MEEGQLLLGHNHVGAGFQRVFSKYATAFYSGCLMALIALERLTFKLMVDRMAPFRFVLAQAVAACYAVAVGVVVLRRINFAGERGSMEGFPVWRLAMMAVLDMLHLVPMIVAAADVAPTLTVLLLQCSAPFCLAVSGGFCSRRYPRKSVWGAAVIFLGACVSMYLPISRLVEARAALEDEARNHEYVPGHLRGTSGDYAIVEGYNTLLYVLACLPAAISTVYKQYALEQHGRPVDAHQLSLGVTAFEVVFIALAAPAAYQLQDLGRHGDGNTHVGQALRDGWRCLVLMKDVVDVDGYPIEAECWGGLPLVFSYVVATLLVNTLVQKVVDQAESASEYHRAMAFSVPTAFVVLCLYNEPAWLHDSFNVFTVSGLLVIMVGLRLYHSVPEPEESRDNSFDPPSPPDGKNYS
ncbi:unnamed protein product [Scytosiphon promiscuus]